MIFFQGAGKPLNDAQRPIRRNFMPKKLLCLTALILFSGIINISQAADEIFFTELFEDDNFGARGWYDGTMLRSTTEHIPGSTSSAEFHFLQNASSSGYGGRIAIPESDRVYLSFISSTVPVGSAQAWPIILTSFISQPTSTASG